MPHRYEEGKGGRRGCYFLSMRPFLRISLLLLVGGGWSLSELGAAPDAAAPASALTLFDAYLAEAALTEVSYRADLRPCSDATHVPLGRLLGRGPMIGPFTYRPKTYDELSRPERAAMLHDPKFHAFLIAAREQADLGADDIQTGKDTVPIAGGKSLMPGNSTPRSMLERFSISPTEMLQRRPILVVLRGQ